MGCLIEDHLSNFQNSFLVSTQKLSWVYISPISILAILTAILIGMYHNAFPPMNGGAFYFELLHFPSTPAIVHDVRAIVFEQRRLSDYQV